MKNPLLQYPAWLRPFFVLLVLSSISDTRAQYVTIPDANFALWIKTTYPGCMSGSNKLDTTCAAVKNATSITINFKNIADLEGIQYFHALTELNCAANNISKVLRLPENLKKFSCQDNYMQYIAMLPPKLEYLFCQDNSLRTLPTLPETLTFLNIHGNYITNLPSLPNGLKSLYGSWGKLDSLPILPDSLKELSFVWTGIKKLPKLPPKLKLLDISRNQISEIPNMPPGLEFLIAYDCGLLQLPELPPTLKILICNNNQLSELPKLPPNLKTLQCTGNQLRCLPPIPLKLKDTYDVYLGRWVWTEMKGIAMENNPFTCLPNYVSAMGSNLLAYPICAEGDSISNKGGCHAAEGVNGIVYVDDNLNCKYDSGERLMKNLAINLRDENNKLLSRQMTLENGAYYFLFQMGTYNIDIDTTELPIVVNCSGGNKAKIGPGNFNPNVKDINFGINCGKADLGVRSVLTEGIVFPGRKHVLRVVAGDMAQWFGLNCAGGQGGKLIISVHGKIKYIDQASGAKAPDMVNGNMFTYKVSNFGEIDMFRDFGLLFGIDTSAGAGDTVVVDVEIVPNFSDRNPKNNQLRFVYRVVNSYDPNFKEVYPSEVPKNYNGWLTYTVHFQNTGTAPAFDIKIIDTLDTKLSTETFEVLQYSHPMHFELKGHTAQFIFNKIMLPDSNVSYDSSCGFVQYRIRPYASYAKGTKIFNKAYIHFDFNSPVITNNAVCEFREYFNPVNVPVRSSIPIPTIFPNPSDGKIRIMSDYPFTICVRDLQGREILTETDQDELQLQKGIYFFEFLVGNNRSVQKVVVF